MARDDRSLVRQCIAGDRAAFDALYDRHAGRVLNLLRRLCGSDALAEDLTQETFLAAYLSLATWRGQGKFGTWLCGIACRQNAHHRQREAGHEPEELSDALEKPMPAVLDDLRC